MWQYKIDKLVMMGHINFEDHALIKRQRVGKTMNVMSGMFKDEKIGVTIKSSLHLLLDVVRIFEVLEFITACV
jgi:hypothetical protein